MKRIASSVMLLAAFCLPLRMVAYDRDHDDHSNGQRYYDSYHKDYHVWNAEEDREYRRYLEERRRKYHDWNRASKKEQNEYWRWRHDHIR
jgi:hypothetical protein